jgi:hypothetical protein
MRSVRTGFVVGAALLATSACGGSSVASAGGPLQGSGAGYGAAVVTVPNRPYTMGGLLLCTNGAAFVLDSLRAAAVHGSGKLEDAGVRSSPAEAGSIDGGQRVLPAVMRPVKGYRVTRVCDSSGTTVSELGIQVSRGPGYGEGTGYASTTTSGTPATNRSTSSLQRCATQAPATTRNTAPTSHA